MQGFAIRKISPCLSRQDFVEICFQLKISPPPRVAGPGLSDYPISGSLLPPSCDILFQIMQSYIAYLGTYNKGCPIRFVGSYIFYINI